MTAGRPSVAVTGAEATPATVMPTGLDVVARTALEGHDGRSGARIERVVLGDGSRRVVKTSDPAGDIVAAISGDTAGRELALFRRGVLDDLPRGVGHCIVDGWVNDDGHVITVMRDVGASVVTWDRRLRRADVERILAAAAAVHRHFDGRPPNDVCPLERLLTALGPASIAPLATGPNPLPDLVLRGWSRAADLVPADVWDHAQRVFDDPGPIAAALRRSGTTLVHGDLWPVNIALEHGQVTLLDWSLAAEAPGGADLAVFLAGAAGIADVTREAMIDMYRAASGAAVHDLRLALVIGFLQYAWNKALDAAEHPDLAIRARERADLDWWVDRARHAFALA